MKLATLHRIHAINAQMYPFSTWRERDRDDPNPKCLICRAIKNRYWSTGWYRLLSDGYNIRPIRHTWQNFRHTSFESRRTMDDIRETSPESHACWTPLARLLNPMLDDVCGTPSEFRDTSDDFGTSSEYRRVEFDPFPCLDALAAQYVVNTGDPPPRWLGSLSPWRTRATRITWNFLKSL